METNGGEPDGRRLNHGLSAEKTTSVEIKKHNRNRIYNLIRTQGPLSRKEISQHLNLSMPTIIQNLSELVEEGLLYLSGSVGNTGGRRAKLYAIVAAARIAIGLDITRNHVTVVAVDLAGNIIYSKRIRHPFSMDDPYAAFIGKLVADCVAVLEVKDEAVLGVGISVPGLITEDHREIFYGKILNFTGSTVEDFSKYIPYPSTLHNDANSAGFAESWLGASGKDAFYISLGNNVGGSILINQQVYTGEGPRSGEVGHMTIVPGGPRCYCGQYGCFETFCSATLLSNHTGGNLEQFFSEVEGGNRKFEEIWNEYLHYLSIAVNNVRMLFDCKVILGGYVGAFMDNYIEQLRSLTAERSTFENNADYLQVCQFKKEAIAAGGALSYIQEFTSLDVST